MFPVFEQRRLANEGRRVVRRGDFRAARKAAHVTQSEVAELVGVSLQTVVAWELGRHGIRDSHAVRVARLMPQLEALAADSADDAPTKESADDAA